MQENREQIHAVRRMQNYIAIHYAKNISLEDLARAAVYSPWHALRAFSKLTGSTPFAYIRKVRLANAAKLLRDTSLSVMDIALQSGFDSHEGFLKAFSREFHITPSAYREKTPPLKLFTAYLLQPPQDEERKCCTMQPSHIIYTRIEERPARKLILKRGIKAADYFAYCGEVGCDVWGELESLKGALYESIGLWLPPALITPGTSEYCQGVEMPEDYAGPIPEGYDIISLPAATYMVFQGEPYPEDDFSEAIAVVWNAIERFNPALHGYEWACDTAPRFQYAPEGARGYIEYRPVKAATLTRK